MFKIQNICGLKFWSLVFWSFGFVSDFGQFYKIRRYSNLSQYRVSLSYFYITVRRYVIFSSKWEMQRMFGLCGKLSCFGIEFWWSRRQTDTQPQYDQMRSMRSMLARLPAGCHRVSASFSRAVGQSDHAWSYSLSRMRWTALFSGVPSKGGKYAGFNPGGPLSKASANSCRLNVASFGVRQNIFATKTLKHKDKF